MQIIYLPSDAPSEATDGFSGPGDTIIVPFSDNPEDEEEYEAYKQEDTANQTEDDEVSSEGSQSQEVDLSPQFFQAQATLLALSAPTAAPSVPNDL